MAKLHYWKGKKDSDDEKDDIKFVPLEEKHVTKIMTQPVENEVRNKVPYEMFSHNEKGGKWKDEKNTVLCMNLIEEVGSYFEKGDLSKAKEVYKKIQKIYPLISAEAKINLTTSIKKIIEEINKREIHSFIDKYITLASNEGYSKKISEKIKSLSDRLPKEEQEDIEKRILEIKKKISVEDDDKILEMKKKISEKMGSNNGGVEIEVIPVNKSIKKIHYGVLDFAAIKAAVRSEYGNSEDEINANTEIDDENYVKTHVPGFDKLMEKGIPKGSAVLMAGGAGSCKTLFTLQTLIYQANQGKKCLFMSFEESKERLIEHMESFGWNAQELTDKRLLVIKRFNPYDITRSVDALLMKAKGELLIDVDPIIFPDGFKPDFIVVDSLTAIGSAFASKEDSYRIYIEQLFRFFESVKATSFLITETQQIPTVFSATGVEEFLADGVFVIYNFKRGNMRENAIEILKLRGAKHKKKIAAMKVTSRGIIVYPDQEVYGGATDM
jgi:KaiC/GvpD/RAD55 family RecA-like ATPase